MSQLLDHQDCIERLQKDLVDLQGAVLDVFSRTGPVRVPSWKFPDKLSCHLDMVALLDEYDFVDGDGASNQHSRVVLLELVIDRLLLLLQSFDFYTQNVRCIQQRAPTPQKGCPSVGAVVKNYWSALLNFVGTADINGPQTKPKGFDCSTTAPPTHPTPLLQPRTEDSGRRSSASSSSASSSSASSSLSSFHFLPQSQAAFSSSDDKPFLPQPDTDGVPEVRPAPCKDCRQIQSVLKMTGGALVKLLQSEGLPSSLQLLLSAMKNLLEPGHMTAEDVGQWANEQLRDIRRLQRHLEDVRGTVDPLRDRLAAAEAELQRLTSELEMTRTDSKRQMEKQQATVVRLEFSLNKAERSLKAAEQSLREKKRELERETSSLEQRNSRLQEKVAAQQETQQVLESEKIALEEKLKSENEACRLLRQTVQELQAQISESRILLDKENTKFDSARRQQESMQTKQKSLLEQVESLDEECEELQRQLEERRDTQVQLEEELQRTTDEKERLQVQLNKQQDCGSELQKEKQMLEANVRQLDKDVAELREHVLTLTQRERLLVAFPELSPLARTQPQSTGNMLLDMEKQMQANDIRIKVLEEENAALRCSLGKVRALGQRGALREPSSPSLSDGPAESPRTDHGLGQKNQLYSSSSSISNVGHERSDSGVMSVGSEGRRGSSTGSPSQPVHLQTLQLKTPQHAATRCRTGTHGVSVHSHGRGLRQRK